MSRVSEVQRVGIRQLSARLGVDRSTIWRWYRAGRFPVPHYLGERRAWLLSDVEAWERECITSPPAERKSSSNASRLRRRKNLQEDHRLPTDAV
jgi:predicted DNA-binding transcriptional regulator AlpA